MRLKSLFGLALVAGAFLATYTAEADVKQTTVKPTIGLKPPRRAILLFDGKDSSKWIQRGTNAPCQWDVTDGCLVVKTGTPDLMTKQEFGDYRLHVEFWLPLMADQQSQGRANSGVYNQGHYEVQVLDSYQNPTYKFGGCGALYGQKDPDVDAIIPPERWNTYDITFRAARFDKAGNLLEKPRITVFHNGLKIHDDVELLGAQTTSGLAGGIVSKGPIMLQDHGAAVRFRNIWIVPLNLKKSAKANL